jgi:hypothetical protein
VARESAAIAAAVREVLAANYPQADVAAHAARFSWDVNAAELSEHFHSVAGKA